LMDACPRFAVDPLPPVPCYNGFLEWRSKHVVFLKGTSMSQRFARLIVAGFSWTVSIAVLASLSALEAAPPPTFTIWPDGAPGAKGTEPADQPTLTVYLPPADRATGAAVVVCPGGGYGGLADHEGRPIAEWLNTLGVAGFVLKYRHAPRYAHPAPLDDASRALRTVRARAAEWGLKTDRIGILGFSAGGHLASSAGTHFADGKPDAADPVERASSRPDFQILIYPVITMGAWTHEGSKRNLLGPDPTGEMVRLLSGEEQVTRLTPPAFLVHTSDDAAVPCENSLRFASACRKAGVPCELHLFETGPHGFGLGGSDPVLSAWPALCARWLEARGITAKTAKAG
jgi:acetyl esterase/lipase